MTQTVQDYLIDTEDVAIVEKLFERPELINIPQAITKLHKLSQEKDHIYRYSVYDYLRILKKYQAFSIFRIKAFLVKVKKDQL